MKEQTYGWYPSIKNVYEERKADNLTPYELEVLYRYRHSKYFQTPSTNEEQKPPRPRPLSVAPEMCNKLQKSVGGKKSGIHGKASNYKLPQRLSLPTPLQCWSTHVPETEIVIIPPKVSSASAKTSITRLQKISTPSCHAHKHHLVHIQEPEIAESTWMSEKSIKMLVRVQSSAGTRKDAQMRPKKSACSPHAHSSRSLSTPPEVSQSVVSNLSRPQSSIPGHIVISDMSSPEKKLTEHIQSPTNFEWPLPTDIFENYDDITSVQIPLSSSPPTSEQSSPDIPCSPTPRTCARSPTSNLSNPTERPPSGQRMPPTKASLQDKTDEDEASESCDYDEMLKRHGWMMEVQGDPLKLKKLPERLPYTVQINVPEIEHDPPRVRMENSETFFLNTIPRRPLSFAIHQEWVSEVLHNKRLERQKRHGINYKYKNFSFVY